MLWTDTVAFKHGPQAASQEVNSQPMSPMFGCMLLVLSDLFADFYIVVHNI